MDKMRVYYDAARDILYLSIGAPRRAISQEIGDDVLLRVDPDSGEVVGLTVLNLSARAEAPDELPLEMVLRKAG